LQTVGAKNLKILVSPEMSSVSSALFSGLEIATLLRSIGVLTKKVQ